MRFFSPLFFIFIGIIFSFILFFPSLQKKNISSKLTSQKNFDKIYSVIVKNQDFFYYFKNENQSNNNLCILIISPPSGLERYINLNSCVFFTSFPLKFFNESILIVFLNITQFLEKNFQLGIITESPYNLLGLFLASNFENIQFLYLVDEFYTEYHLTWQIFQPRICYYFESHEKCNLIHMQNIILKNIYFTKIKSKLIFFLEMKKVFSSKNYQKIQKNIEFFHAIKHYSSNLNKKIEIYDKKDIENKLKFYILN